MAYDHIDPGSEIEISSRVYFSRETDSIGELTAFPLVTLEQMKQASITLENAIYEKLRTVTGEWEEQARQTLRLMKAMEYLRTPAVKHTSNAWKTDQYGNHEISNMVYTMTWRMYEDTKWDRAAQKSVPVAWQLSWYLHYNTTHNPDASGSGYRIAGQDRKRFTDKAEMEKYMQGRIAAYAHLFTELSPPIPEGERGRFSVNGQLLPGYTVEAHTPTVNELLDFLEDEDVAPASTPEVQAPPKVNKAKAAAPAKADKKKTAPTR